MTLVELDLQSEDSRRRSEPFRGARAMGMGLVEFLAAGRDRILDLWRAMGREGVPEAVKPLRGPGKMMALALCDLGTPGRIPLAWGRKRREVSVNLARVFRAYAVTIPRKHWLDLTFTERSDSQWGTVLLCNLENLPVREMERRAKRSSRNGNGTQAQATGQTATGSPGPASGNQAAPASGGPAATNPAAAAGSAASGSPAASGRPTVPGQPAPGAPTTNLPEASK